MKNIYDVMRQKEAEIQQLQKEIEALRVAAHILAEDGDPAPESFVRNGTNSAPINVTSGLRTATPAAPVPVNKATEVTYSAARENSLRQFP